MFIYRSNNWNKLQRYDIVVVNYTHGTHPVSDIEIIIPESRHGVAEKTSISDVSSVYCFPPEGTRREQRQYRWLWGYPTIPPEMATNCDVTLVSPRQIFNSAVLEKQDIANVPPRDSDTSRTPSGSSSYPS